MAQDTTGTNIKTNAAASGRQIAYRFMVDWADAGYSAALSGWTDESQYVKSATGTMTATDWRKSLGIVGHGTSDECVVICRNPDEGGGAGFRFSSTNSLGSLYSNIKAGRINMKRAVFELGFYDGATPQRLRQITGYIVKSPENYANRQITFHLRDRAADCAMTQASSVLYANYTGKAFMQALVGNLSRDSVASTDQQFDTGMIPIPWAWLDDERVLDEMHHVAEAQMGRVGYSKDGVLRFDDGSHFVKPSASSWLDPTVSQASFTVASFRSCDPSYDPRSVYNHIKVEYQPRYVAQQQVIYASAETVVIPPGGTKDVQAEFSYPAYSTVTPVANTDYYACTGGGTDITSSVTVSAFTASAAACSFTLTNASTVYSAYMTLLQVRGQPLLTQQASQYEVEDAASIDRHGWRTLPLRNPYIQTYRHAQMAGDFLLARFKDPILTIKLAGVDGYPWLETGDRVTVTETLTGISDDFFIASISWRFAPKQGYLMDLELFRAADVFPATATGDKTPYFVIGTSRYGAYDKLFW